VIVRRLSLLILAAAAAALVPLGSGAQQTLETPAVQPSPDPASPSPLPSAAPEPTVSPAPTGSPATLRAVAVPTFPAGFRIPNFGGLTASPAPYATFVKNATRQSGLIDILAKDDETYFDLGPQQLDHPFIIAPVLASGVGSEAFAGRVFDSFIIEFKRVGKRVLWINRNSSFSAPPNSAAANALAISVTDSVINSTPIVAEDSKTKRVVVSAAFFLTDFENVAKSLGGSGPPEPVILLGGPPRAAFSVDASKSYIERTKALPENDEILASLAFSGPPGEIAGAPDGRGVRLRMHYSIIDAPTRGSYVPRLADDRVGYFITAQKRFNDDTLPTPFVRYIDRWNFNNGPIVYYLTNEIPAQYKGAIRTALLSWNAAFAKVGIPNAIEVRDQPDDPSWDPDDARYSTVRWITSDHPAFSAYGPHIADPRTGEILRVEIVIDGEALRSVKRGFVDQVKPTRAPALSAAGLPVPSVSAASAQLGCQDSESCDDFAQASAEMAAAGTVELRANGAGSAAMQSYADHWLRSVVLHESGHNFGLRHNFAAFRLYPLPQIHDKRFTQDHGLVASVMGYAPLNLSPPGRPQGDYFQLRLGPYDYWAIRYGYAHFSNVHRPDDESAALRAIADESTRPQYAYATDEDANGPLAIDPYVATFALGRDPLNFYRNQFDVYDGLVASLDRVYPRTDEPYYQERATFETLMRGYERAALLATKYVGGIQTSRAHRGQPGGAPPFRSIPRAEVRRAFALLAENVFSSHALRFSPELLADLGPDHYLHRGVTDIEQPDFPLEDFVGTMQDDVMFQLFSPDTMSRLANQHLGAVPGTATMSLDDLFGWMQAAVWDDVDRPSIDPLHRNLQRRYTNLMIAFSLAPSFLVNALGYPGDTVSLARYELRRLDASVTTALRDPRLDVPTRAHLEDVQSRVRHALDPGAVRGA